MSGVADSAAMPAEAAVPAKAAVPAPEGGPGGGSADEEKKMCACCHDVLDNGSVQWLACGHVFHKDCLDTYMSVANVNALEDLVCPSCKNTADGLLQVEMALKAQQAAQGHGPDDDAVVLHSISVDALGPDPDLGGPPLASTQGEQTALAVKMGKGTTGFDIDHVKAWTGEDVSVRCLDCGKLCNLVKSRLLAKQTGKFRCNTCSVTIVQILRKKGPGFRDVKIPDDERKEFFQACEGKGTKEVMQMYSEKLEKYEVHERAYALGGKYLPLSVLATQGYDIGVIQSQSLPVDVQPDRMFGSVYRVPILAVHDQGFKGQRSNAHASTGNGGEQSSGQHPRRRKMTPVADAPEETPVAEAESGSAKRTASSSSSSSSSSRLRRDKKKQKKKQEKVKEQLKEEAKIKKEEEKQKKQEEKQAMAARSAANKKEMAASAAAEKKLAKVGADLEHALHAPGADLVPQDLAAQFMKKKQQIWDLKLQCSNHAQGLIEGFQVPNDLCSVIESAKKSAICFGMHTKTFLTSAKAGVDV